MNARLLKISKVVPPEHQYLIPYGVKDSLPFFNINYPADLEIARRMMAVLGRG
jgi:molybdopterin-guanine dinucleotide biosynthesis protein A